VRLKAYAKGAEKAMAIASAHRQKKALLYVMDKLVFDSKPLSRGEATPEDNAALRNVIKASSAECPFCHWGFDPAVLTQHVREKHANEAQ